MKLIIHRGAHEIGGSCVEVKYKDSRIILDIGMPLFEMDGGRFDFGKYKNLSNKELVQLKILPDISGFYSWDKETKSPDALFISHAHSDHYGLCNYLRDDLPVYLGEGTKKLIEITELFLKKDGSLGNISIINSGKSLQAGSFKITPFLMDHSAFDSYAFLIEAGDKKVIYTGDFRAHGRKGKTLETFLKRLEGKTIDALLLEGSLVSRGASCHKQKTEQDIEEEFVDVMKTPGIVFVSQSSQNIDRLVSCFKAALRTRRLFVIDIYTACILDELKQLGKLPHASEGFVNIRVFYPRNLAISLVKRGHASILERFKDFRIYSSEIITKQNNIAMLYRPSMNQELQKLGKFKSGSMIYSMWSGYLKDKSMEGIHKFVDENELTFKEIHTSGHADVETLKKVVSHMKPKNIIPIHTMKPDAYLTLFPEMNVMNVSDRQEIEII